MKDDELQKLIDIVKTDSRYGFILHCIASDIIYRVSMITSSVDLISLSYSSSPSSVELGLRLTNEACNDLREIVDEILLKALAERLSKQ